MAAVAVAAAGCSAPEPRSVGCGKDTDCKDPRVCERGVCVNPHPPAGDAGAAAHASAPAPGAAAPGPPPFAMFGGDARHTGRRGGPAPAKAPKEVWSAKVGGAAAGSPTIGPDGTIYVASHDGGLYAIAPDGQQKW